MFFRTGSTDPPPFSRGRSPRYSDRLNHFSVTIPKCFFARTARPSNSLPIECFPLVYHLKMALSLELTDTK